jgi:hypothetical protein
MENTTTPGSGPNATVTGTSNGVPGAQPDGATDAQQQTMQRAEELADRLGEQIGSYAGWLGRNFRKWVARAREEAEDIWAEAQAVRGQWSTEEQPEGAPPAKG